MKRFALALALLFLALPLSATAEESGDTATVTVHLFVLESFSRVEEDTCRPDTNERNSRLRMESTSPRIVEVMHIQDASIVDADNDIAPGESGCLASEEVEFPNADAYEFTLDGIWLMTAEWDFIQGADELLIIVDEHGPIIESEPGLIVPTPEPTPAPTPEPAPAGEQPDGDFLLRGYLELKTDNVYNTPLGCFGFGGFSDIGSGTQVIVRDGEGNVIGVGELQAIDQREGRSGCSFLFEIIVEESSFYQISISHRGETVYAFDSLEEEGWIVHLAIGS